jgi:hypothetical protein
MQTLESVEKQLLTLLRRFISDAYHGCEINGLGMTARVAVYVASARIWRVKNHSVRTRLRDTSTPVAGVRRLLVNAGQQGVRFDVGDEAVTVGAFMNLTQSEGVVNACHGASIDNRYILYVSIMAKSTEMAFCQR